MKLPSTEYNAYSKFSGAKVQLKHGLMKIELY